jgi:hypothetical protein
MSDESSRKNQGHYDVFISYAQEDKPVADAVCVKIESKNIRCWIAPRDIPPGKNFPEAIVEGIEESKLVALIFSSFANKSPHVTRELTNAVNKGLVIIPFRIEDVIPSKSMEYLISVPHWLDAITPPLDTHIEILANTVENIILSENMSPAPPVQAPSPPAGGSIKDLIENTLKGSKYLGTFTLPELFRFSETGSVSGIAIAKEGGRELYLSFIDGEAEGAIYVDKKGELYGDKAVMMITGHEKFVLYGIKPDNVEAVVVGCRILEKIHLRKNVTTVIPEIGKKSQGIGHLRMIILRDRVPQKGSLVSIRRAGKIDGSDVTTEDGSVGFRVMYGDYDCIVQDRNQRITSTHIKFSEATPEIILDLRNPGSRRFT